MNLSISDVCNKEQGVKTPTRFHYGSTIVYLLPQYKRATDTPVAFNEGGLLKKRTCGLQSVIFFFWKYALYWGGGLRVSGVK